MTSLLVRILPIFMALMYSMFIYLTLIDPKTLWAQHYPNQPMDVVFSYACKAKGAAITGLLVGLLVSYTRPLQERALPFLSCLVFQGLALIHHSWCYFIQPPDYFVKSDMHFQYVVMHSIGVVAFGYLVKEASADTVATKTKTK